MMQKQLILLVLGRQLARRRKRNFVWSEIGVFRIGDLDGDPKGFGSLGSQ